MTPNGLFGTSGIRGPADTLFTSQFCFDIGRTFIQFLKDHNSLGPIAIGMDPRESSPRIKKDLLAGLATADIALFDEGVTPIPSINWLIKSTPVVGAIMITGSHIAPELNGLKFYAHDEEVSEEDQHQIENIYTKIRGGKIVEINKHVEMENKAARLYADMLFGLISNKLPQWRVALDCANGAQSVVIPQLLTRLGLRVIEVNCDIQQDFIARDTDTDDKAQLELLKSTVVEQNCDFGVAFDGDGDRMVFVDETGQFVQGEYTCSLITKESPGDTVVTTISASQVVDKLGKKVIRTKVGSPYVVGAMKKADVLFGFEPNGGAVSAEIMYTRDGGGALMKIFNIFSSFNGTFSELIGTLPKFYMDRTKVDYKWELQGEILSKAKEEFKGVKVEDVDGLKIWLDDSTWILFRSSQNAPEFRVFAESKSATTSKELLDKGIAFVENIIAAHAKP